MAKKQSNTSENSAAEQGAKPGMFIPMPTAEITNAAETARIRAEREAKEKADKKAADAVIALIRAIGVVEYTDACLEEINAAKQAYTKLTADQKKLVDNADVITTSEKEYDKLKNAAKKAEEAARKKAEKEAKEKADKETADAVIALIRAIGVVEYTDACLEKINAANQAYAKLTADQKKFVKNADVLTASENKYKDFQKAEETARKKAAEAERKKAQKEAEAARKKAEEEVKRKAIEAARKKAEKEAREKAEQEGRDKEIESILLAYCKKKGSSLTSSSSRDHAEYDMPRNRYDEIYEYVLRKNKQQRNFSISVDGYDYFFYAASNNKSYGISVWRKINTDGLWDLNEKKKQIGRTSKIFTIGLVVLWAFFLIVNAIYTWVANSWFSCIIWVIITFAVFFGIMSLMQKIDEEHPIETKSPDAGTIAHLAWRICWVLGLSIICEIIMMVIFVF